MARAIWNGTVGFGLVQIPVGLYPAEAPNELDLTLLDKNPLADIRNMSSRAGVMVAGRWLPQAELQRMLDGVAAEMSANK